MSRLSYKYICQSLREPKKFDNRCNLRISVFPNNWVAEHTHTLQSLLVKYKNVVGERFARCCSYEGKIIVIKFNLIVPSMRSIFYIKSTPSETVKYFTTTCTKCDFRESNNFNLMRILTATILRLSLYRLLFKWKCSIIFVITLINVVVFTNTALIGLHVHVTDKVVEIIVINFDNNLLTGRF